MWTILVVFLVGTGFGAATTIIASIALLAADEEMDDA